MDMVISHMGALELLRCRSLEGLLAAAGRTSLSVPAAVPTAEQLATARRGLATFGYAPERLELMVGDLSSRVRRKNVVTHLQKGALPASSFVHILDGIHVVSPEHLCVQLATRLSRMELTVLMAELLGTYALREDGMFSREAPLMTRESMKAHLDALGEFKGARVAREVLGRAPSNSASPMETKLYLRVSLPRRLGGYALPVKALNEKLEVGLIGMGGRAGERRPDITMLPKEGADAPYAFVALEYDGEAHLTRARQAADQRRSNEILSFGGREYHVNKELYDNLSYMDDLMGCVAADLGRTPCRVTRALGEKRRLLRLSLKRELDHIDGVNWDSKAREKARSASKGPAEPEYVPLDEYWF